MAGWTADFPADNTTDWSHINFQNQLRAAIGERLETVYYPYLRPSAIATRVDLQDYFYIRQMQQWIETVVNSGGDWIVTVDAGGSPITSFDFTNGGVELWTLAGLKNRVLPGPDWTRKYPDASGNTVMAYGLHEAGDYIGPWLWNEMQAALNAVFLYLAAGDWSASPLGGGAYINGYQGNGYAEFADSSQKAAAFAAAKAEAEGYYAGPDTWDILYSDSGPHEIARIYQYNDISTEGAFGAGLWSGYGYGRGQKYGTLNAKASFYAYLAAPEGSSGGAGYWDVQNLTGATENQWYLFEDGTIVSAELFSSAGMFGNATMPPNWPAAYPVNPDDPDDDSVEDARGWRNLRYSPGSGIYDRKVLIILDYRVTGGFGYY